MPEKRKCLVHVYGVHQLLPAMCAVRAYGLKHSATAQTEIKILIHWAGLGDNLAEMAAMTRQMLAGRKDVEIIALSSEEMDQIIGRGKFRFYSNILKDFRAKTGADSFDEVYYCHDLAGRIGELIMNAFPDATRIMYGDGLGQVYDARFNRLLKTRSAGQRLLHFIVECKRRIQGALLGGPRRLTANVAALILPADWTGNFLDGRELIVVDKKIVLQMVDEFLEALPEFRQYVRQVNLQPPPQYMLLLSNIADIGGASLDNEAELFLSIVRAKVPKGAALLLKPHPFARQELAGLIAERLGTEYRTSVISPEFARYPIELWKDLATACKILVVGASGVHLKYLYNSRIEYAMEADLIRRYYFPHFHDLLIEGDRVYRAQMERLKDWDGRGVLWSGKKQF